VIELLTTVEYEALTGKTVDVLALQGASGIVRAYCKWAISSFTVDVRDVDSDGGRLVVLPCLHVTDVSSVVLNGTDYWGNDLVQPVARDWQWFSDGRLEWLSSWPYSGWVSGARRLTVTYSGGYEFTPDEILMVVCSVAERIAAPSAIHQKLSNVGGIQTNSTYSPNTDSNGLTDLEKNVLDAHRIAIVR